MLKKILVSDDGWRLFLSPYRLRLVAWFATWSAYLARGPPMLAPLPLVALSYGPWVGSGTKKLGKLGPCPIRPLIPLPTGPSQAGTVEAMAENLSGEKK